MPSLPASNNSSSNSLNSSGPGPLFGGLKRNLAVSILVLVFVLIITIAIGVPVYSRFKQNKTDALKLGQTAQKSFSASSFKDAASQYQDAYKKDSSNDRLLAGTLLAIASQGNATGKEAQALADAKPYIAKASSSQDKDVLVALGYLYETAGKYDDALSLYEKAIQKDGNSADAWFHKGHVLAFLGRKDDSQKAYDAAYKLDPSNPQVLMALGGSKVFSGDLDSAYKLFIQASQATQIPNLRGEALTDASGIKRTQGYIQDALNLSTESVKTYPNSVQGLSDHGINLVINGKAQEGVDSLKKAMQVNPRSAQPYWWLGVVLRSAKQYEEAIKDQKIALQKIDNDNTIVGQNTVNYVKAQMTYDLAKTYWMMGNDGTALSTLQDTLKIDIRIRDLLKNDYQKYGHFKSLGTNPTFNNLIQS